MRFAHVETGYALDPQDNASADEYLTRFPAGTSESWVVERVSDDAVHGAKYNGPGSSTNPTPPTPTPPTEPAALTKAQFLDLLTSNNGSLSDALDNWPVG